MSAEPELDIHDPDFARDPYPVYDQLRRECPAYRSDRYGGFVLLTRYADVRGAAVDWRTYTSSVVGVTAIPVITRRTKPQLPIEIDPPAHSAYRAILNPMFSTARVASLRRQAEAMSERLFRSMLDNPLPDAVADYTDPFSMATLGLFTGLPSEEAPLWKAWLDRMFDPLNPEDGATATAEFGSYIGELIDRRKVSPKEDFISVLLEAEIEGRRLSDDEIRSFLSVMFGAGFETTSDAMSGTLHWLAENRGGQKQLFDNPGLIPQAVEEFLRFISPIQIFGRNATRDLEVHACPIHSGEVVALGFGAANHDSSAFPSPEVCQLDRSPNRHLAFGAGPHLCLGAPVARMELDIMLRHLTALTTKISPPSVATAEWKKRGDRRGLARLPLEIVRRSIVGKVA